MMKLDEADIMAGDGPATVIARHLQHDDAVIRCAAAKALVAQGETEAAPALVEALLDEDPDVRTDAMEALIRCARPEDAEAIRRSLEGDPVKEVKVFAIEALAQIGDRGAIPLLRALAKDRADEQVAWEDEAGMWDDWLDVQLAAIEALGRLQASEAIDDLLDARTDEMGQELDIVVFATLAEIEDGGLSALFALLRDRDPKVRKRVIQALSKARPEAMLPMQAILLRDANPAIRRLAIDTLLPDDQAVSDLALEDADPGVRGAALSTFASARPDLVMAALRDPDERVLAVAVQSLPTDLDASIADDLAANLQAWMETAGTALAAASAKVLPKVAEGMAADGLCRLAANTDRPTEARIAALQALPDLPSETVIEMLEQRIEDPVRQIRAGALAALSVMAGRQNCSHQNTAEAVLAAAVRGELGADVTVVKDAQAKSADDVGASKMEGGSGRITISPDGEIIAADDTTDDQPRIDDNVIEGYFPTSTLAAIQTIPAGSESQHPPSTGQPTKRRRVAVDGPDDVKQDIRVVALGMLGNCSGQHVEQALLDALVSEDEEVRLAAFKAVARQSITELNAETMIDACKIALSDKNAAIRSCAATVIGQNAADAPDLLSLYATDPDPFVRDVALKAAAKIDPEKAMGGLSDPSSIVRHTAMQMLITSMDKNALKRGIDICLEEVLPDVLIEGCGLCSEIRAILLDLIGKDKLSGRQLRIALEGLAHA